MIQDKQNILKSFEGKKIDESVHVARWGTINNEDSSRNIFNKYAMGSNSSPHQSISQVLQNENQYATQQSQVHQIDTGFKKLKTNQIQKLKELKQQYEVLRNLNIQQKPSLPSLHKNVHSSSSSINQSHSQQLISSSSRHKKSSVRKENMSREAQILSIEKKQLEMVINNSMRKIQELLHNQMEYKKQVHELKLQASGRQNVDVEYQTMIKTLKKNEMNQQENIEALKKENQKTRYQTRQLNEKISSLESQVMYKDQQIRLLLGEKRKSQDLIRLQKDRYFNLDIDYKKTKMEYELLEKDKNNEIARLTKQLDYIGANRTKDLELKLKRYEEDLEIKDKRYNVLLTQLEDLKSKYNIQQNELHQLRSNQQFGQLDSDKIEQILVNFREKNDSVTFTRQMNQVIDKIHETDHHQNEYLRQQIESLKIELQGFKENERQPTMLGSVQQYIDRIDELQRVIRNQAYDKEDLINRLKRFERQYEDLSRKSSQTQKELQYYQELQTKLREEIKTLKEQSRSMRLKSPETRKDSEVKDKESLRFKQQIDQLENELRVTKRLADQHQFKATKTTTELEFRLKMQQSQHDSVLTRIRQDFERQSRELSKLKQQYEQYKSATQRKLSQKETQLETLRGKLRFTSDGTQSNVNNVKLEYESILKSERQRYKAQVEQLSTQLTSLSKINEKFIQQSSKYVQYENELSCLREIMRRSIHLSEGVDHLWRIKETEYQNINEVLRQVSAWGR